MALRTRLCELLGIEYPILLAGMGGASVPALAAAVSEAGGLGVLGAADCGPEELREWIAEVRRLTDRPFGVNTLLPASVKRAADREAGRGAGGPVEPPGLPALQAFAREFMEREKLEEPTPEALARVRSLARPERAGPRPFTQEFFEAQMEVVIEERVPVYASGLGSPAPWLPRLHAAGTRVMVVVGDVRQARRAAESGLDAVVAQGCDGGGHNSPVGTLALIPQVVDALGGTPVLAAGGIADGRGVAAALMLGAEGAWVGTAFLATEEAGIPEFQKRALVEADGSSTTVTRAWTGKPARVIRGSWTEAFEQSGRQPLPMPYQQRVSWPVLAAATVAGRGDVAPGVAGQGMGLIRAIRPAREVFAELVAGAEEALRAAATRLRD